MEAALEEGEYDSLRIEVTHVSERGDEMTTQSVVQLASGKRLELSARHTPSFRLFDLDLDVAEVPIRSLAAALRGRRASDRYDSSTDVQVVGAALFEVLFSGGLERAYGMLMGPAEPARVGARIQIVFPAAGNGGGPLQRIAALPWEAAYDTQRRDFVALLPRTSIVRAIKPAAKRRLRPRAKPRMLVISTDYDDGSLGAKAQYDVLRGIAAEYEAPPVEHLANPSVDQLRRALGEARVDIIHFIGTMGAGAPMVAMPMQVGEPMSRTEQEWLHGASFAEWASANHDVQLVYLSASRSAPIASLILAAAPATLGMQGEIQSAEATEFARAFYDGVFSGARLDDAANEARRAVDRAFPGQSGWALPVLSAAEPDRLVLAGGLADVSFSSPSLLGGIESMPAVQVLRARQKMARRNLAALQAIVGKGTPHARIKAQIDEESARLAEVVAELARLGAPEDAEDG